MTTFLTSIYCLPLKTIFALIMFLIIGYAEFNNFISMTKFKNIIHIFLLFISIILILRLTLLTRQSDNYSAVLIPFYSLYRAIEEPEIYREMLMNIFLFVPFGASLSFVFKGRYLSILRKVLLIACSFSMVIELLQFILKLGVFEIDDIITNTLGAFVGTLSLYLYYMKACDRQEA